MTRTAGRVCAKADSAVRCGRVASLHMSTTTAGQAPAPQPDDEGLGLVAEQTRQDAAAPGGKRRRWLQITLIGGLAIGVLVAGGTFAGWRYLRSVESSVTRVDAFQGLVEQERPAKPPTEAMNFLILGSDSRNPDIDGSRTDTIMLAHVTKDHESAQIVSIPRDTWVTIPNGDSGNKNKINAAFAVGGIPLMVRTVESITKIRIDHVMIIDFAGFAQIVDALGGIDVNIEKSFRSIHPPKRQFQAGLQHLNGAEALDYSRQRKQFADGDFSRIEHQQQVVKAVLEKATTAGVVTDPGRLTSFLSATAQVITADAGFDLLSTALELRGIGSGQVRFITNPSAGTGMVEGQSVVYADTAAAETLYAALRDDTAADWVKPPKRK
jgi:LCP family protein required for cell wall assembly